MASADRVLECMTVEEASVLTKLSKSTLYVMAKEEEKGKTKSGFPFKRIGKRIIIPKVAFQMWLEKK